MQLGKQRGNGYVFALQDCHRFGWMNCTAQNIATLSAPLRALTDGQLSQIKTFLFCRWLNSIVVNPPPALAAPADAAWTMTWLGPGGVTVQASIVSGTCPTGSNGFEFAVSDTFAVDPNFADFFQDAACNANDNINVGQQTQGQQLNGWIRWKNNGIPVSPWSNMKTAFVF